MDIYNHQDSLGLWLSQAGNAFAHALQRRFREKNLDVTFEMWGILNLLWEQDGQMQNEISRRSHRNKSNITRLIDNLLERNLVVRIPDRTDKRINLIYLTKAGKDLQNPLTACAVEITLEARKNMPEADWEKARQVLEQVFKNLTDEVV
jgi:DNA-binding MarR family transcriptional regulator